MENDQDLTGGKKIEPAAGEGGDQKTVPLAALEDERGKRKAAEERSRLLEEQNALYRANVNVQPETPSQKVKDPFEGMEEGDVMTVGEFKKIFTEAGQSFSKEISGKISELQTMQWFPDYKNVVQKHLPNVLKEKPHLGHAIKNSANPYVLAYELAKTDPKYLKTQSEVKLDKDGQTIIENLNKPQIGNLGGGGGLDKVDTISNLTDEQLEERIAQVKNK